MNKPVLLNVPTWKLALYGFVAALGVSGYGLYQADYRLVVCGFFAGAAIFGFGLFINKVSQGSLNVARCGSISRVRHLRMLLTIYVVLQTVLLIWTLLENKH